MKETHAEGLASHSVHESCAGSRKGAREALTVAHAGWVLSLENFRKWSADAVFLSGRQHRIHRYREMNESFTWSQTPHMYGNSLLRNWEVPRSTAADRAAVRIGNPEGAIR